MDARFQATDRRIDDTRELLCTEFRRVEEIADARLSRIEQELHLKQVRLLALVTLIS